MANLRRVSLLCSVLPTISLFFCAGSSSSISTYSATFLQQNLSSSSNSTNQDVYVFESTVSNFSWWKETHQEYIISDEKLASLPPDSLPLEYWVPVKPKLRYWPDRTIPFQIHTSFRWEQRQIISNALKALSRSLGNCLEFRQKRPNEVDYLQFRKATKCCSPIGYQGGKHRVTLSDDCLDPEQLGAVQHEVLHALGFFHEHSRKDRDDFIEINWNNVQADGKRDLKKLHFKTFGLPYDYTSVLHYTYDAYAINEDVPTLRPKSTSINITEMGQRIGLSATDIERVAIPYKCEEFLPNLDYSQKRFLYQRSSDDNEDDGEDTMDEDEHEHDQRP